MPNECQRKQQDEPLVFGREGMGGRCPMRFFVVARMSGWISTHKRLADGTVLIGRTYEQLASVWWGPLVFRVETTWIAGCHPVLSAVTSWKPACFCVFVAKLNPITEYNRFTLLHLHPRLRHALCSPTVLSPVYPRSTLKCRRLRLRHRRLPHKQTIKCRRWRL